MFMEIAIGAIGIGVVLMVGYLVVAQIRASLATSLDSTTLNAGNKSVINNAMTSTQGIVFAGFGLIAVGIIVLAAFGLINIFK
jgi:NAD/NADP transhydrogenase alpha subunit